MKSILGAALITLLMTIGYYQSSEDNQDTFDKWSLKYGKNYMGEEKLYRQQIYLQNKKIIEEHNADSTQSYKMGENQFMTLTKEEFVGLYLNYVEMPLLPKVEAIELDNDEILGAVDWRNTSTVKAQGSCASGWAISVSSLIESWYYIRGGGQNISVSAQQIVDCDVYSSGCSGGVNYYAMYYVQQNGVLASVYYPYVAKNQTCQYYSTGNYRINNYTFVGGYQSTLQSYIQNYPVSVGVDASNWQFYQYGLFNNCGSSITNHYALAVGFDSSNNWIVQNSFGISWGESGHIRLYPNNTCGILNQAYQVY